MSMKTAVCLAGLACVLSSPSYATDFHLSAAGNDSNPGTAAAPWQTLARVNTVALRSGDRVLLRGGDSFRGTLLLEADDAGTAASPITITSYGGGRATIRPGTSSGITVYNTSGVRIADVNVAGDAGGTTSGIVFYTDLPGGGKLPHVRIESVEVSGFGRDGIEIGSWNGLTGFRDVRIIRAWTHHNARTGILVYAQQPLAHQQVYVGYSRAFDNPGIPGSATNSGSGIVLGGVDEGTVEWSVAARNGTLNTAVGGPVGIWAYDAARILIQHNESYANRTSSTADGGGFDLDQNVSESVLQFNYSHDNDGAGYLLAHSLDTPVHRGNTVRYNVSENDGRRNSYGGIELWGRITGAVIHNNTIRVSPAASGRPSAVRIWNGGVESLRATSISVHDNAFVTTGGLPLVDVSPAQASASAIRFEQNLYSSSSGAFNILWNGGTYGSLASWRSTGEELREGLPTGAAGTAGAGVPPPDIVLTPSHVTGMAGGWRRSDDSSSAIGSRLWHPDTGLAKITAPLAAPVHYFDMAFHARAGRPYRLWMRLKADADRWSNDSVFAQFSQSVDAHGSAQWRIGSGSALEVNLEECSGCGVAGWGWQDTGYGSGVLGPVVYFATDGPQTLRVQTREDGVSIDEIVLASEAFVGVSPGSGTRDVTMLPVQAATAAPFSAGADTPATTPPSDVILRAVDVATTAIAGDWRPVSDATAAAGVAIWNPNRGAAKLGAAAQPASYFDLTFTATAGVDYHLWVRMRAEGNSYTNDSVTVQFSGATDAAGAPYARLGTTSGAVVSLQDTYGAPLSGWGWNDTGWASMGSPVRFDRTGTQTIRIQQREDGIFIDQIVLSPQRFLGLSPGSLTGDNTIVGR